MCSVGGCSHIRGQRPTISGAQAGKKARCRQSRGINPDPFSKSLELTRYHSNARCVGTGETSSSVRDVPGHTTTHALTETSNRSPRAKCNSIVRNTSVLIANKTPQTLGECSLDVRAFGLIPSYSIHQSGLRAISWEQRKGVLPQKMRQRLVF